MEEIKEKQKIDSSSMDANQDVIALARTEEEACVQVFFMRNGKIIGREHFILEGVEGSKSRFCAWLICKTILYGTGVYTKRNNYR